MKKYKTLFIIVIIALVLALLPWPYAYYQLLRWLVCGSSAYVAYDLHSSKKQKKDVISLTIIAVVFNPIAPIYLTREIWSVIDIVTAGYFGFKFIK